MLNSDSIVIDAATVLQPQNDSVLLSIASHIYVPGPFTVQTEPTQLQLYVPQIGSAYPMAELNLPGIKIHKNTTIRATNQYTVFENYTSWQSFVHNTIFLNTGGLGLKGKIITKLGKIKEFTLDLDKAIPSNGMFPLLSFSLRVLVSSIDSVPGFLMCSVQDWTSSPVLLLTPRPWSSQPKATVRTLSLMLLCLISLYWLWKSYVETLA